MQQDRIILPLTPETGLKLAPGVNMLMYVPEDCPKSCGLPRRSAAQPLVTVKTMKEDFPDLYEILGGEDYKPRKRKKEIRYGCPHCLSQEGLRMKRRIERMNRYRENLAFLAKQAGFELPVCGFSVYFYLPIPKQWAKKKREQYHGQLHMEKPDVDNMTKLMFDSLSIKDERVAQLSGLGKFWVDKLYIDENGQKQKGEGYIEILLNQIVYNPFNKELINQDELKKIPKRKWTKRETGDPLKRIAKKKVKPLKIRKELIK